MAENNYSVIDLRDHPELVDQYVALRNRYVDLLLTLPVDVPGTLAWLRSGDVVVRCLLDDAQLEGVVLLYLNKGGEIAFFVRTPGRGLGSRLLQVILETARERSLPRVWAWVLRGNVPARNAFLRCGFEQVGESERFFNGTSRAGIELEHLFPSNVAGEL